MSLDKVLFDLIIIVEKQDVVSRRHLEAQIAGRALPWPLLVQHL